ncbi:pseudouridine synthase [Lysobacter humi (ex Lee et al. 2017)]
MLSKRGICSRTQAAAWIREGRVRLNGRVLRDPEHPVVATDHVEVVGLDPVAPERLYVAVNKPRGLVTTTRDEQGRDTVYRCLDGAGLPWLAPVGRLDKASEGLLLFTNDPAWAAAITDPRSGPQKTYHVQIDRLPAPGLLAALESGREVDGEHLAAARASLLRAGSRNAWLEIVLDEGRNRHIRRLLDAQGVGVLRLVRVAIGGLALGDLAKGAWRALTPQEVAALGQAAGATSPVRARS